MSSPRANRAIIICALTLIVYLANQIGQSEAQNDSIEREVAYGDIISESGASNKLPQNNPNAFWLLDNELNLDANRKLAEILKRVGPNMKASADYQDYQDIELPESVEAWRLFREQAKLYAQDQVQFHGPKVMKLLRNANVSLACQSAARAAFQSAARLESWPIKMWSAWGNFPPVGLFDGQFTSLGSYRGCVDLGAPANKPESRQTTYCMLAFRPIVPVRPKFHMIFEEQSQLVSQFNSSDSFHSLASRAQYFYYIYLKTGVCVPAECTAIDMQQVANLIASHLVLQPGPVKCFTRARVSLMDPSMKLDDNEFGKIENRPVLVELGTPMNQKQIVAAIVVMSFFLLVLIATVWHLAELSLSEPVKSQASEMSSFHPPSNSNEFNLGEAPASGRAKSSYVVNDLTNQPIKRIAFNYFSLVTNLQDFLDISIGSSEIKCLHSIRVLTMLWIILVHTFQYNEWSGFTRVFEIIATLQNPFLHPIYNANYSVDNFFFLSGLLAAYTTCRTNKNDSSIGFNLGVSLIGRYLRLTPQVLLISLLYILLPLAGDSPFWYDVTHDASRNCEQNWWINLLHLQAFYKTDEICNLVSWWISVDMFYYIIALGLMYLILKKQLRSALMATILIVASCTCVSAYKHFTNGYPPNNLGTVPQVAEMWTNYVVNFFWSPYPHSFAFYLGLWIGWALANNKWRAQVRAWSRFGWTLSLVSLVVVNMSSHIWMSGSVKLGSQLVSTTYNNLCTVIWASALAWIVAACHYDCAPLLNRVLSMNLFALLSKASFIIYLSHMLLVRMYFGLQNSLLEVSPFSLGYTVVGNSFVSIIFGIFLCVSFEGPCMKFQKLVTRKLKQSRQIPRASPVAVAGAKYKSSTETDANKFSADLGPVGQALLK